MPENIKIGGRAEMKFEPIYTQIVGVTKKNEDGTSRQDLLAGCEVGDEVYLERDQFNKYDPNAIEVFDGDYQQLGYLNKGLAQDLAPLMDAGLNLRGEITNITGGEDGKETLGCNILISLKSEAAASWGDIQVTLPINQLTLPTNMEEEPIKSVNKIGFWGCLGALVKFILLALFALVGIIIVIGCIKGW